MGRYTFQALYIDPIDFDLDMTGAVLDHIARVLASARAFGAEVEPTRADRALAKCFTVVGIIDPVQDPDMDNHYVVTVEAPDTDMNALTAALEGVE
jgi:hypothetical protein